MVKSENKKGVTKKQMKDEKGTFEEDDVDLEIVKETQRIEIDIIDCDLDDNMEENMMKTNVDIKNNEWIDVDNSDIIDDEIYIWKTNIKEKKELNEDEKLALYLQDIENEKFNIQKEKEELLKEVNRNRVQVPGYWEPFEDYKEVELVDNPDVTEEFNYIINHFTQGGILFKKVISLKRIQHRYLYLTYAAQKIIIDNKDCNGGFAKEIYLFHGPRNNTESIKKQGFVSQYANSCPYGVWFSTLSSVSGNGFEDRSLNSRRIFIARVCIGTPSRDDGSGRRPGRLQTGELGDCHYDGSSTYVLYQDRQAYPEYLIEWK